MSQEVIGGFAVIGFVFMLSVIFALAELLIASIRGALRGRK